MVSACELGICCVGEIGGQYETGVGLASKSSLWNSCALMPFSPAIGVWHPPIGVLPTGVVGYGDGCAAGT
eukprot:7932368-Pyramimonas_sp.AAC.1